MTIVPKLISINVDITTHSYFSWGLHHAIYNTIPQAAIIHYSTRRKLNFEMNVSWPGSSARTLKWVLRPASVFPLADLSWVPWYLCVLYSFPFTGVRLPAAPTAAWAHVSLSRDELGFLLPPLKSPVLTYVCPSASCPPPSLSAQIRKRHS